MPERTERRQRRVITSSPAPQAVSTLPAPAPSSGAELQPLLQQLRDIARMRRYSMIGRLSRVQVMRPAGAKTIDFRKDGPVLAFAVGSEQIIVTTPWPGLPSKWDDTDQFCKDCLSACDVCNATGKKVCEGFQCGGSGKVPLPIVACSADECLEKTGHVNPKCTECGGSGNFSPKGDCKMCGGTGVMTCPVCRGSSKRPTGIKDGSVNWKDPACSSCQGSKFAHTEIPQAISDFVDVRIGPMIALGPIVRFAVESVGGEGTPPQVFDVMADSEGRHMVILLESEQPGAGAFMIGGVLNSVTRR